MANLRSPQTRKASIRRPMRSLRCEALEKRIAMATFGTPWPNSRSLSVSFPTDEADIGHFDNSLRSTLDQVADRRQWQEAVLRAFQTWAVAANINIGLVPDRGDDFGTPGLATNDPRFGEFRIGAFPQSGVLANASPFQPRYGTWSGDVLINTNVNFFLANPAAGNSTSIPASNEKGPATELFSVLLHEAGNALGLADNSIPGAVMNGRYSGPNGTLKPSDITAIRQLYGARRDIFELVANNTRTTATQVHNPPGFNGSTPLTIPGSLNTMSDVDFYRITPVAGKEKVTIRLVASGISLLKSKVEVLDRFGKKIGDVKADSVFENNLEIEVGSLNDFNNRVLFLRVARNADDVFAVGDYQLELDYRPRELQPSIVPPPHDADAVDEDASQFDQVSVDLLFAQAGIVDRESGANDTLNTATRLDTTAGFLKNTRYESLSSLAQPNDRDLWVFRSPSAASPVLHISIDNLGTKNPNLEATVLNRQGDRIATSAIRKADGGLSLTIINPTANTDYIVAVRAKSDSAVKVGNYILTADFATNSPDQLQPVYSANVRSGTEHVSRLSVKKTQLFRFDLLALANADSGVQLTIYDTRSGDIVTTLAGRSGQLRTEYVWLSSGNYYLRATVRARGNAVPQPVRFSLRADSVSDDQGPLPIDPTQTYTPEEPTYEWDYYPDYGADIIDYVEPPYEDPWASDYYDSYYVDYYEEVYV